MSTKIDASALEAAERAVEAEGFTTAWPIEAAITAYLAALAAPEREIVARSPVNAGNIVYRGAEWVPLSAYSEAMSGWKAANALAAPEREAVGWQHYGSDNGVETVDVSVSQEERERFMRTFPGCSDIPLYALHPAPPGDAAKEG
jgi:hypothetical protein